jgi:hypothetical protein
VQLALGVGPNRIPGPLRPIKVDQRALPTPVKAAAEVHQSADTLDQRVNMYGARVFTARVAAWPSDVEPRLRSA